DTEKSRPWKPAVAIGGKDDDVRAWRGLIAFVSDRSGELADAIRQDDLNVAQRLVRAPERQRTIDCADPVDADVGDYPSSRRVRDLQSTRAVDAGDDKRAIVAHVGARDRPRCQIAING